MAEVTTVVVETASVSVANTTQVANQVEVQAVLVEVTNPVVETTVNEVDLQVTSSLDVSITNTTDSTSVVTLETSAVSTVITEPQIQVTTITAGLAGTSAYQSSRFGFTLDQPLMDTNVVSSNTLRVLVGYDLTRVINLQGFVDGRYFVAGSTWEIAPDSVSIDVWIPSSPSDRAQYVAYNIQYEFTWLQPLN